MIQFISIKQVIDEVLVHPLLKDVGIERGIAYAIQFMRKLGIPKIFEEKVAEVKIEEYRGFLPCDFIAMTQVKDKSTGAMYRYATDTFHYYHDNNIKPHALDFTYKLQGNCIYTNLEDTEIIISYRAIKLDCDGFMMLPDNESFLSALKLYIKKECFAILFDEGKININVMQKADRDYAFAVGQAHNNLLIPSIDEMISLSNMLNQMIIKVSEPRKNFMNTGSPNNIKLK